MPAIQPRHLAQQRMRIGMRRTGKKLFRIRALHHTPQVHHHHAIGNVFNHGNIMADEHIGKIQLFTQSDKKIDDLRLNGNIQRRY